MPAHTTDKTGATDIVVSSVTIKRTELLHLTFAHPKDWKAGDVQTALCYVAGGVEALLPLGVGRVELDIRKVTIGSPRCDDPEWITPLVTEIEESDEDDSDGDDEEGADDEPSGDDPSDEE